MAIRLSWATFLQFSAIVMVILIFNWGLRKSRYEGTNRGTKGTVVNQTLLLLPRFPYKNIILSRYLDFRIGKKPKSRYKLRRVKTLFLSRKQEVGAKLANRQL